MDNSFKIEIISPEKIEFSEKTTMTTLPSYEGDMSVLKNHIPIITFLRPGIIRIVNNQGALDEFFVQDGTVEFFQDTLAVLSSSVKNLKDLSKEFLQNLTKETQDKLVQKDISDHERFILSQKLDVLKEIRI